MLFVLLLAQQISANDIKHFRELSNHYDTYKTAMNSSVIMGEFLQDLSKMIKNGFQKIPSYHSVW